MSDDSQKYWSGVLEWKWSIKLGIIAVTEDIEYSKHFTGDEERKDHDERNAEELRFRCHLHYLFGAPGIPDNFID